MRKILIEILVLINKLIGYRVWDKEMAESFRNIQWNCTLDPDCKCDDCEKETEFNNTGGADRW